MKAGVAISPDTPSTAITDEIGNLADMLLVMTVYPGAFVYPATRSSTNQKYLRHSDCLNGTYRSRRPKIY